MPLSPSVSRMPMVCHLLRQGYNRNMMHLPVFADPPPTPEVCRLVAWALRIRRALLLWGVLSHVQGTCKGTLY